MNEPACLCAVKERGPLARGMLGRRRRPIRSRGSGGRGPEPGLCRLAWPGLAQHGPARPGSMQELARLRRVNRDLLGRLRAQQEEIRRRLPRGPAGPAPRGGVRAPVPRSCRCRERSGVSRGNSRKRGRGSWDRRCLGRDPCLGSAPPHPNPPRVSVQPPLKGPKAGGRGGHHVAACIPRAKTEFLQRKQQQRLPPPPVRRERLEAVPCRLGHRLGISLSVPEFLQASLARHWQGVSRKGRRGQVPLVPCRSWCPCSLQKENRGLVTEGTSDPETLVSVAPSAARAALCSPTKPAVRGREGRGASRPRTSIQRAAASEGGSLRAERSCTPAAAGTRCARGASRAAGDSRSPEGESLLPGHGESSERFVTLRSPQEKGRVGTKLEPVLSQTQAEENGEHPVLVREPRRPKSILLMPQCREAKEAGHVTFQDNLEEYTIPEGSWSVRPLLGYDWIAGLLETDSSVSEKSEQYFAELQEFRLVNKEACVYEQCLEPEALDYLAPEQDVDLVPTSHQCIYCFRLNKRLFPVPVDSASACPICKTPRAQRPPETLEEPAYIRVSIPRATLLPAHKYKIHRRKSFEAADNLALPSHCLVGWENVIPFGSPTMSSLDLRTSLEEKPTDPFPSELGIQSVRRN